MSEKQLKFNVEFKLMPETLESPFNQHFLGYIDEGLVKSEPGGTVMPTPYKKGAEKIYNFQPRKDDTWIVTFAKCGIGLPFCYRYLKKTQSNFLIFKLKERLGHRKWSGW